MNWLLFGSGMFSMGFLCGTLLGIYNENKRHPMKEEG